MTVQGTENLDRKGDSAYVAPAYLYLGLADGAGRRDPELYSSESRSAVTRHP